MENRKKRQPKYTDEFRKQIVMLVEDGRSVSEIGKEYGIAKNTVSGWCKRSQSSGSFRKSDNMSEQEKEIKELRKANLHLRMENDILKKAMVIMSGN